MELCSSLRVAEIFLNRLKNYYVIFYYFYPAHLEALTKIRRDNLVNKTNGKNMLVTLTFEQNGIDITWLAVAVHHIHSVC